LGKDLMGPTPVKLCTVCISREIYQDVLTEEWLAINARCATLPNPCFCESILSDTLVEGEAPAVFYVILLAT
jgi:hypothetical protein